jgi:hypothetical protein
MDKNWSLKNHIRFRTPEQLQRYLEKAGSDEFSFRVYPISGDPETFYYSSGENAVTRDTDGSTFDSLSDFICYTFQCDTEGYANTEYVDFELLN